MIITVHRWSSSDRHHQSHAGRNVPRDLWVRTARKKRVLWQGGSTLIEHLKRQLRLTLEKTGRPDLYLAAMAATAALLITRFLRIVVEGILPS
jgi:hypothetical protein